MELKQAFEEKFGRPARRAELDDPYYIAMVRRANGQVMLTERQKRESDVMTYFPLVANPENGVDFWGGDQRWFVRKAQRQGGCGPTAATNVLACMAAKDTAMAEKLGLTFLPDGRIEKDEYARFMEEVYRTVGTGEVPVWRNIVEKMKAERPPFPPSFGRGAIGYEKGVLKAAKSKGIYLAAHRKTFSYLGYDEGFDFIKGALEAGHPVGFLTVWNRHPLTVYWNGYEKPGSVQKNGVRSHFMTMIGLRAGKEAGKWDVLLSSWGRICTVGYDELCKSWQSPLAMGGEMVYFTPDSEQRAKRDIVRAYGALPQSIGKTIVGTVAAPVKKLFGEK